MKLEEIDVLNEIDYKFLNIIKILMTGRTFKIGEAMNIGIAKTIDGGLGFYYFLDGVNRVFGIDNLSWVYKKSTEISDDDITIALAEIALQEFNKKKR